MLRKYCRSLFCAVHFSRLVSGLRIEFNCTSILTMIEYKKVQVGKDQETKPRYITDVFFQFDSVLFLLEELEVVFVICVL